MTLHIQGLAFLRQSVTCRTRPMSRPVSHCNALSARLAVRKGTAPRDGRPGVNHNAELFIVNTYEPRTLGVRDADGHSAHPAYWENVMPEQKHSSGFFQRIGTFFHGRDPRLNVPPEPPLLTTDAVHAVLREVGLLLDYLNRQPEPRLKRYFGSAAAHTSMEASIMTPTPPCTDLGYFLGRIAAIAARGRDADPNATTQPPSFKEPSPKDGDGGPQDGAAGTLPGSRLGDLAFLIWTRDFLTSVAAPATLDTIRVTRAYRAHRATKAVVGEERARHTTDERDLFMSRYGVLIARRVHRFTILAFLLLWCSLYVSYLVYTGQNLLQENATLRGEYAAHDSRVKEAATQEEVLIQAALRTEQASQSHLLARTYCDILETPRPELKLELVRITALPTGERTMSIGPADGVRPDTLRLYVSDRQRGLCTEFRTLRQREAELAHAHRRWWEHAVLLRRITQPDEFPNVLKPWVWFSERPNRPDWHLETFRYRMQHMINGLLAGVMPAMYAALGALASLFRRLAQKVETERLAPADYSGMMSSLVLGILTGAVIGLFTGALPQAGQGTALPLSTTALALLAGYATESVFNLFDNLANRVFPASEGRAAPGG